MKPETFVVALHAPMQGHIAILTIMTNNPVLFPTATILITCYVFQKVSSLAVLEHVS